MEGLSIDNLYFVHRSTILAKRETLVLYESDTCFRVHGPKIAKRMKPYFIVVSKNDFKIIGFYTSENEKIVNIDKLKNIITSMTTCIGKDGRKFMDALVSDISRRIDTQIVLDGNFYNSPETDDDDKFINEEIIIDTLKNSTKFITI